MSFSRYIPYEKIAIKEENSMKNVAKEIFCKCDCGSCAKDEEKAKQKPKTQAEIYRDEILARNKAAAGIKDAMWQEFIKKNLEWKLETTTEFPISISIEIPFPCDGLGEASPSKQEIADFTGSIFGPLGFDCSVEFPWKAAGLPDAYNIILSIKEEK